MFYCRLISSSGSDIINAGAPLQIVGAEQQADGSWALLASGLGPAVDPATHAVGPLQWVRGARSCSY